MKGKEAGKIKANGTRWCVRRGLHVVLGNGHTGLGGEVETDVLERVEDLADRGRAE